MREVHAVLHSYLEQLGSIYVYIQFVTRNLYRNVNVVSSSSTGRLKSDTYSDEYTHQV